MPEPVPTAEALIKLADSISDHIRTSFRIRTTARRRADRSYVTKINEIADQIALTWCTQYDIGFISTDQTSIRSRSLGDYVLYAHPLDGATAYLAGRSEVSVVLTLMQRTGLCWVPLICVISEPMTDWTWSATKGNGVRVVPPKPKKAKRVATPLRSERPYHVNVVTWQKVPYKLQSVRLLLENDPVFCHQASGNVGINGPLIATGCMHAVVYGGAHATVSAAITLMVREAGGVVTDFTGKPITNFTLTIGPHGPHFNLPNGLIAASTKDVAEHLRQIIAARQ